MTTDKEQEAFGLVLERHKSSASENDIRAAFQRFMETASIAALAETTTEGRRDRQPRPDGPLRPQHLYRVQEGHRAERNYRFAATSTSWVGYLDSLLKAGTGVRNGILTDGVHYFLRRVGEEKTAPSTSDSNEHLRPR